MITINFIEKTYTYIVYISLIGMVIYSLLKAKQILSSRGMSNLDENIIQNNDPSILKLNKKEITKSLTVRYFSLFTFSGFLLVFGFMGKQTLNNSIGHIPSIVISFLLGLTGLIICALVEYAIDLMIKHDAIFSANTIGLEALVYEDIKAKRGSMGKIRLTINQKVTQFDAVTNAGMTLSKGTKVKITNSLSDTCVVVEVE